MGFSLFSCVYPNTAISKLRTKIFDCRCGCGGIGLTGQNITCVRVDYVAVEGQTVANEIPYRLVPDLACPGRYKHHRVVQLSRGDLAVHIFELVDDPSRIASEKRNLQNRYHDRQDAGASREPGQPSCVSLRQCETPVHQQRRRDRSKWKGGFPKSKGESARGNSPPGRV